MQLIIQPDEITLLDVQCISSSGEIHEVNTGDQKDEKATIVKRKTYLASPSVTIGN
jgi:hypothetical protein